MMKKTSTLFLVSSAVVFAVFSWPTTCALSEDRDGCEQGCAQVFQDREQECPQVTARVPLNTLP